MTQEKRQGCKLYAGWRVLEAGDSIPAVEALDASGKLRRLHEELAAGWGLVYFYPRARTPGCTRQACSLRDAWGDLQDLGVKVYGVSTDPVARQKRFQERRSLPFTLLADPEKRVIAAFGVPAFLGFAARMAFLFRDGKLVWRDRRASTGRQAEDVLAFIRAAG